MIDVVGGLGEFGGFVVKGVARQTYDAEEACETLFGALLRPVERRSLRVGVDQDDAHVPLRAHSPAR